MGEAPGALPEFSGAFVLWRPESELGDNSRGWALTGLRMGTVHTLVTPTSIQVTRVRALAAFVVDVLTILEAVSGKRRALALAVLQKRVFQGRQRKKIR